MEIQAAREKPRLWIERLIIFADTTDPVVLREISFTQGLNVIWGIAQQVIGDEDIPGILTGHSVGKTLLCRLIRYCLGEHAFGRKDTMEAIRHAFPRGAVGATIHIDDVPWSVVRSIGISEDSSASSVLALEELIVKPQTEYPYSGFRKGLDKAFLTSLPSPKPPEDKEPYLWDHILAWLTRDQETRYQNLWQWRSGRSDSQTPTFTRRKQNALFLIRMVLGIADERESKLIEEIENLKLAIKEKESRQKELSQEPENRIRYAEHALLDLIGPPEKWMDNGEGLFGFSTRVESFKVSRTKELERLKHKRHLLDKSLTENKSVVRQMEREIKKIVAAIQGIEESREQPDEKDEMRQKLESAWEIECTYGNIEFKKCSHYRAYLGELRGKWIALEKVRREKRVQLTTDEENQAIEQMVIDETRNRETLERRRSEIRRLEIQIQNVEKEIERATLNLKLAEYHIAQRREAQDLKDGKREDSELKAIAGQLKKDRQNLRALETSLGSAQIKQYHRVMDLKQLYDKVLKSILSENYTGEILLPPKDDLAFVIRETVGNMTGEAVESLALVLADVTAMLWAVEGNGHHPCFLLHDSPREADLDRHIYSRFLCRVHEISKGLGGRQAPFQYILTTTTVPPLPLRKDETIRLELEAHPEDRLLFKRFLRKPEMF
ncbi:hypothetical protein DSCW_48740 [Desulfosarcina widdelii]|uniref:Uncharacterized protein n=1 Tax=Desulfosarcina widdelii TaxID=947919 RepID=A0A5K7ZMW6_9BACT|nr:hypothetical protein [Desulfosarcina widdelii]BBO77457.1 hypothetical protein DSCW_48740 [Desulfosarcina widdelii]